MPNANYTEDIDGQDSDLYQYDAIGNLIKDGGSFTRNICAPGGTGSTHTYTVAVNTYSSCISQEDADVKAQADLNTNGQNTANIIGVEELMIAVVL